jgi:hypothetical protein
MDGSGETICNIAVIAIHGVGDHLPQEMAKAAGGLLESRQKDEKDLYGTFEETLLRLHVEPVKLSRVVAPDEKKKGRSWGPLDALRLSKTRRVEPASAAHMDSIDHVFMEGQLSGYKGQGPEDVYEFLRVDTVRTEGSRKKRVHIHDMFWSDLSGVSQVGFKVFGDLYQLLFHLGSVGVNNVAAAAAFFRDTEPVAKKWNAFTRAEKVVAGAIAFPVALLNLILAAIALAVFATAGVAKLTSDKQSITAVTALVAVVAGGLSYLRYHLKLKGGASFRAPLILALAAIAGAAIAVLLQPTWALPPEAAQTTIAALAFCLTLLGAWWIVTVYEARRPGALRAFGFTLLGLAVCSLLTLKISTPWVGRFFAMAMLVRTADTACWLLAASWFAFWCSLIWAFFSGMRAVSAVRSNLKDETERAKRTNWTARLTIVLPAALFLLVTVAAWSGLLYAALPMLPRDPALDPKLRPSGPIIAYLCATTEDSFCYVPISPGKETEASQGIEPARTWADDAFYAAGLNFLPVLLVFTAIALLITLYAVIPSVLAEVVMPPSGDDAGKAEKMGVWLTLGYTFMRWSGRALYLGVFLFPPVVVWGLFGKVPFSHGQALTDTLGALIGGTAVGVLAFGGRLSKLALGLRTGVRVGLDVDNWLREHPHGTNPTARICARYVSLLRHIAAWRDEKSNKPYDALVIFAHSQGTVITADLLRFLQVEQKHKGGYDKYDPSLQRLTEMKIFLFTVGCPLQQLYGLRFPYIYGYANKAAVDGPDPADLNVHHWTNGYRTGDYVGRYLWRTKNFWEPDPPYDDGSRTEFAVGPGAHTHYWDETADRVAEKLDKIIARA